jgi:hypothetical protein
MRQGSVDQGWLSLLKWEWIPILSILLGGVLVQSMNVLMLATVLPSIVAELGGVASVGLFKGSAADWKLLSPMC